MKTPQGDKVAVTLVMNDYQAINLRWLLRTISDAKYSKEFFESRYGKGKLPENFDAVVLNTGDWAGELLWELEERIKTAPSEDNFFFHPNEESPWPLEGWGIIETP